MNKNEEVIDHSEQSIGLLYLSRYLRNRSIPDDWVYNVYVDGALLMSSVSPLSERELATRGIAAHRGTGDLRVLIGGLGLGYTAQAALESDRASLVRVVDAMDFVIGWLRDGHLPLSEQLNNDKRLELPLGDVYGDLLGPPTETWDVILVDVDHSPVDPLDAASLPFYTVEGQRQVQQHLAPGGVLVVWSAYYDRHFAEAMAEAYPGAWNEAIAWTVKGDGDGMPDMPLSNVLFFGRKPEA